ncbi:MAG TPA: hypothetical protein HA362_01015 [Nanoarchaeota archaeon]|nr:hypothetical protein [Nanoarchaeota archaeon]
MVNNAPQWKVDKPTSDTNALERFILEMGDNTLVYDWYWLGSNSIRLCTRIAYAVGNGSGPPEDIIYMNRGRVFASNGGLVGFGTHFIYPNLAKAIRILEPHIGAFRNVPTTSTWHQHEIPLLEWLVRQQKRIARGKVTRADLLHFETEYHVDEPPFKPTEELLKERYELDFRRLDPEIPSDRKLGRGALAELAELYRYDKLRLERGEVSLAQLYNLNPERIEALKEGKDLRELGYLPRLH